MARPLLWLVLLMCATHALATRAAGLRLKLTHIDAKENRTIEERIRRSLSSMGKVTAPVHSAGLQYIAEYLIGDPPQRAEAIIDTGSNLIWTQCSDCLPAGCFNQSLPYYDSSLSRTDQLVACTDAECRLGDETQCASDNMTCAILTSYGAGGIAGVLATEIFTFQPEEEKVSLAFGCITATELSNGSLYGASGIIGLGRGALSLVSQLGDTMFSYCLTPYSSNTSSHLLVGACAGLNGDAPVTSVPFVKSPDVDPYNTFYYLPLAGITVGESKLAVPAAAFELRQIAQGMWAGTFIDSGNPFTYLVDAAYRALRDELARQLGAGLVQPPQPPAAAVDGMAVDLCVAKGNFSRLVPPLALHFGGGGGDVVVPPENYWATLDTSTSCMVVFNSAGQNSTSPMNETTVIGNYMTQDMHLLYDLSNGVLSFQPADCSSM